MERDVAMIEGLSCLGFSEPEARTFEALTRAQPATAYAVAKLSGLARANSYGAVSALLVRGAIRAVSDAPVRYAVADPQGFFPGLARDIADTAQDVTARIAAASQAARADFVETVEGAAAVAARIGRAIDGAAAHLHLKTVDTLAAPHLDGLAAAADRGVRVTVVGSGGSWGRLGDHPNASVVPHEGTGSAPSDPHRVLFTLVGDGGEAIVADMGDPPRAYVAANAALVYLIRTMILHEIYLAEIITAFGADAMAERGVDIASLRARLRPDTHGLSVPPTPSSAPSRTRHAPS
ncbi:TrmB family transcriptional regulator [Jannaschia sp. LMIT008]|uniref:TrmB family transcriptional regulator n=1 Tax=Jannaschia maritima TaxID=3032585 RepID=UPI002811BDFC|nr:helix-turn-helix domain-containing protein [Jannaschia sp. LMIT008]